MNISLTDATAIVDRAISRADAMGCGQARPTLSAWPAH